MHRRLIFLFFIILLVSCTRINRLSEKDYKWMPYKGNDTLVFRSNTGIEDTIFLLKKDTLLGYADPLSLGGTEYEVLSIFCRYADPTDGGRGYYESNFLQINKDKNKQAHLDILLSAVDARFYRLSKIKIDSLEQVKPSTFQTRFAQYNDVYIIKGEDYMGSYAERSDFVTKLYWSKSNGLIRYDKKDSVYWELSKKW